MIRLPPRSTPCRSSAASDVYKRQVAIPGGPGIRIIDVWTPPLLGVLGSTGARPVRSAAARAPSVVAAATRSPPKVQSGAANVRNRHPFLVMRDQAMGGIPVSYTHLRAHETRHDLVCRLLLAKK